MKEYTISKNDSGQRLNKFLEKAVPLLPPGLMHKYCRLKRIKVGGKRTDPAYRLMEGDLVQLYINDEFFESPSEEEAYKKIKTPRLSIVYEDEHILLADKAPGMVVHADERGDTDTLIAHIQAYLVQSGQWNPADALSFTPALCNRIDRNTGGIVIAAKTAEALRVMNDKIKHHELKKKYLCIVHGTPKPPKGLIESYLRRDEKRKQVELFERPTPGAKIAKTIYRTLTSRNGLSLVECALLTGRTHQIRAHMASIGCPLLGDGKYGRNEHNKRYGETGQLLYSYQLTFWFESDAGALSYLDGKTFTVKNVPFVKKYFPDYRL
ncbi:MAG: RluA family pseudouridine synthase [Clostridiaceae bacterium]|nr:RluA family pseudouridine synthase [Clostridiaceae bacterium]